MRDSVGQYQFDLDTSTATAGTPATHPAEVGLTYRWSGTGTNQFASEGKFSVLVGEFF